MVPDAKCQVPSARFKYQVSGIANFRFQVLQTSGARYEVPGARYPYADYLLELLQLRHVLLERRQLLLVGHGVLLERRQGGLVLLLQLALLEDLLLELLVELLELLELGQLLGVLLQRRLQLE